MEKDIEDIQKLINFLQNQDNEIVSDSESDDSIEFINEINNIPRNSSRVERIDEDAKTIINKCKNEHLKTSLICNIKKRQILNELLWKLESYLVTLNNTTSEHNANKMKQKQIGRKKRVSNNRLGIPYFKDQEGFASPLNNDYKSLIKNNQLVFSSFNYSTWTPDDKVNLAKGAYKQICSKQLTEFQDKDEKEAKLLLNGTLIRNIATNWHKNKIKIIIINDETDDEEDEDINNKDEQIIIKLVSEYDCNRIDWLKISAEYLKGRHTEVECKAMWTYYMNPKFNKNVWTESQNEKLKKIAKKYNYQDWDTIALELNISKSAYQCCIHFHSKLCEKFNKSLWTAAEDKKLLKIINMCRMGDHISWAKVAFHFKNRSRVQIYERYRHSLAPKLKKGAFSIAEDVLLLGACEFYGKINFTKINQFFPNRTVKQLQRHFVTMNDNSHSDEWTLDEDIRIIKHANQYGSQKWSRFKSNRSSDATRHRYYTLRKWFYMNPDDNLSKVVRRRKIVYKRNFQKRVELINLLLGTFLARLNETKNVKKIFNIAYVEDLLAQVPDYKFKQNRIRKPKCSSEIDIALINYFRPLYKRKRHVGRRKKVTVNISESAETIHSLLHSFKANLKLLNPNEIETHPELNDNEKEILYELLKNKASSGINQIDLIPANEETLTGLRGMLLHQPTFESIAEGINEDQYHFQMSAVTQKKERGLQALRHEEKQYLESLDSETRETVLKEQRLFSDRFQTLFHWASVLAQNPLSECIQDLEQEEEEEDNNVGEETITKKLDVKRGRGRPKKFYQKIELMNKRKLEKKQSTNPVTIKEEIGIRNENQLTIQNNETVPRQIIKRPRKMYVKSESLNRTRSDKRK